MDFTIGIGRIFRVCEQTELIELQAHDGGARAPVKLAVRALALILN
jgi:hypothetical protein